MARTGGVLRPAPDAVLDEAGQPSDPLRRGLDRPTRLDVIAGRDRGSMQHPSYTGSKKKA
jgi:hypothetical protein